MQPSYPCPNPACTHTFSPEVVKGASSLVCPRCGGVFQFGTNAVAPVRPSGAVKPPVAKPVAAVSRLPPTPPRAVTPPATPLPPPRPAAPAVPVAAPVEAVETPAALNFNSTPDVVVPRTRRPPPKSGRWRLAALLAILGVVILGLGVAVWVVLWAKHFQRMEQVSDDPIHAASQFNFRFAPPGKPWKRDTNIELKLHVNLGMRSSERNNCMGLYFKDYKTRLPGEPEMVDEALGKLRLYFQGLEWEKKSPEDKPRLGGRDAVVIEFQGEDADHVQMNGECWMTAFRGFGYWFFTWGPLNDKELVSPDWDMLREQFAVLDGRKGWSEKPRESEKVRGEKVKYQLSYVKGLWTQQPARDYDPLADVVLRGDEPDPERKKHASKAATLQVLILPKAPDLKAAATAAREYVEKRQKELYAKIDMQVLKDKNGAALDRPADIGDQHGQLTKLQVQVDEAEHFMVLAVVNRPEGVLVLLGDCLWERRDFWDQELMQVIKTLKAR